MNDSHAFTSFLVASKSSNSILLSTMETSFYLVFISFLLLHFIPEITSTKNVRLPGLTNYTRSRSPYDHQVFSGMATLINAKQVEIQGFNYDGSGPYAYWSFKSRGGGSLSIPHEFGDYRTNLIMEDFRSSQNPKRRCEKPGTYRKDKVVLTLPQKFRWSDIEWIGMYCYKFKHLFNYMPIPSTDQIKKLDNWGGNVADCNSQFGLCKKGNGPKFCYDKCADGKDCAADVLRGRRMLKAVTPRNIQRRKQRDSSCVN